MAVRVGHLQDPEELPGLAHFLVSIGSASFFSASSLIMDLPCRNICCLWGVPSTQEKMSIMAI